MRKAMVLFGITVLGWASHSSSLNAQSKRMADTTDVAVIRAERQRQNTAIAAHNLDGIAASWEADINVTAGMGTAFQGSEPYRRAFEEEFTAYPDTRYERKPSTIELSRIRALAAEQGTWTRHWTSRKGKGEMHGTYMAMWHKTDSRWRIRSELFVLLDCAGAACPPSHVP